MVDKTMKTGKRGFTLIELIVVIAVLAILALLIVPQVTGYVDQANDTVAKANAKTCYNEYLAWKTAKESGLNNDTGKYPSGFTEITGSLIPAKERTSGCYIIIDIRYEDSSYVIGPTAGNTYYSVLVKDGSMYQGSAN
jgi:prepilin-type N-terminal cleavage/methylation domain-containing protein